MLQKRKRKKNQNSDGQTVKESLKYESPKNDRFGLCMLGLSIMLQCMSVVDSVV